MENKAEILKALRTIKNVCIEHEKCETCPLQFADKDFHNEYCCAIGNKNPCDWKIKSHETIWRAFED